MNKHGRQDDKDSDTGNEYKPGPAPTDGPGGKHAKPDEKNDPDDKDDKDKET